MQATRLWTSELTWRHSDALHRVDRANAASVHVLIRMTVHSLIVASNAMTAVRHGTAPVHPRHWSSTSRPLARVSAVSTASSTPPSQRPVQRVAVVGAGVGGLSFTLSLRHHHGGTLSTGPAPQVDVYEQYGGQLDAPAGAAFNLNGGAAVLCDLGLEADLRRLSNPMARVLSRTVTGQTLMDLDIPVIVADAGASEQLCRNGTTWAVTCLRAELLGLLASHVTDSQGGTPARLVQGKQVAGVSSDGRMCFTDGAFSDSAYDLVVAADGIRSSLRTCVGLSPAVPKYSGIRIAFAVAPRLEGLRSCPSSEVHQWFGPNGYGLVYTAGGSGSDASTGAHCLALCWRDDGDGSAPENGSWNAAGGAKAAMQTRLRAGGFPDEVLRLCEASTRVVNLGVYGHSPSPGPWWKPLSAKSTAGPYVVLMGDAVHAMPPFLGQGANQAIQDAYCLAGKVAAANSGSTSLPAALAAYEAIRRPPTATLQLSSAAIGLLDTLPAPAHYFRDLALYIAAQSGIAGRVFINGALPRV